jgi:hypothetical protein
MKDRWRLSMYHGENVQQGTASDTVGSKKIND